MIRVVRKALASVIACLWLSGSLQAQAIGDVVDISMLSGWRTESGTHMSALQITLAPGWKTYWRAPGDAGIPPHFDWMGSENVGSVRLHWPVPEVYFLNGLRSIGYDTAVTLPIEFVPRDADAPIRIAAEVTLGICEEICIPVTLRLDAELPKDGQAEPDMRIKAALRDRPMTAREAQVGPVVCSAKPISDGLRVAIEIAVPSLGGDEHAAIELHDKTVWIAEPSLRREGNQIRLETEMVPPDAQPFALARDTIRVTMFGDRGAVDIQGCSAG